MIKERLKKLEIELGHTPVAYLYARISREDYRDVILNMLLILNF
ncbi:hypothetical protein [Fusobacterium varium]|nr:hypothetical protein [Fusobacterium varium]